MATPSAALLARLLRAELQQQDDLSSLAAEELALELLLAGSREAHQPDKPVPPWLRRVHEMLREESGRRFTLAELAHSVGRHPVQVCRQFIAGSVALSANLFGVLAWLARNRFSHRRISSLR